MQTETIAAEQIHKDFYGAEERLYVEAIGLSKGSLVNKTDKSNRLKKLGFGAAKPIKKDEELSKKRAISGHIASAIEYFRTYYPQNKFITEAEVKRLCEKYSLLLGEVGNYTGDVPEKNIQEIETFKLRKEDWRKKQVDYFPGILQYFSPRRPSNFDEWGQLERMSRRSQRYEPDQTLLAYYESAIQSAAGIPSSREGYVMGADPYKNDKKADVEYEQPAFKICAPKEDFNTSGFVVQDGYRLVYDPIVLQPVSKEGIDGYLIITAWGAESEDEIVKDSAKN